MVEAIGTEAFIIGRADQGPFSLASMLVGTGEFLVALALPGYEEKLARLLAFAEEVVYRYAVAQMEQGAHLTSIGESIAGPGGGLVFAAGHNIQAGVPPENILALFDAADEFGRY